MAFPLNRHVVIVTGSRNHTDHGLIAKRLALYPKGTILLHGDCAGADTIAGNIGALNGFQVTAIPYFPDDKRRGDGGPRRNELLVDLGVTYRRHGYDVTVEAFPLTGSVGTWNCVNQAKAFGLKVIGDK